MKTKHLLFSSVMLMLTALTAVAQDATNKHLSAKDEISFGKKLPPPDLTQYPGIALPQMIPLNIKAILMPGTHRPDINAIKKQLETYRQQQQDQGNGDIKPFQGNGAGVISGHGNSVNSDFHLTKDINALSESNPSNRSDWYVNTTYAILDQVMYFSADDGIHGNELWRSNGTPAGTFMVKDIEPGTASSSPIEITEANGKLYFSAITSTYGREPWVSDGTASGTQKLAAITTGFSSIPAEFTAMGNKVYFAQV